MREAKHVALVLALIGVAGLLGFLLWASRCPIEASLEEG